MKQIFWALLVLSGTSALGMTNILKTSINQGDDLVQSTKDLSNALMQASDSDLPHLVGFFNMIMQRLYTNSEQLKYDIEHESYCTGWPQILKNQRKIYSAAYNAIQKNNSKLNSYQAVFEVIQRNHKEAENQIKTLKG